MNNRSVSPFLNILIICLALSLAVIHPGTAAAVVDTVVSVSAPGDALEPGEQFTIDIRVEPGVEIAGVQFDLTFDPSLLTVDSVDEGNLLSQDGASTYFSPGTIDNMTGSITGAAGAIITPGQSVSTPGIFAVITLTAGTSGGTSPLTLSNVIAGDINGQPVQVNTTSGQVTITSDGSTTLSPSGGGGGGGGGGTPGVTYLTDYITGSGRLSQDVTAPSADDTAELSLAKNTICLNRAGQALRYVSFQVKDQAPAPPGNATFVGPVYDIGPADSTFAPALSLSIDYDEGGIPDRVAEKNLVVATYNGDAGQWQHLECTVSPDDNRITAEVNHFSVFTILAYNRPASFAFSDFTVTPGDVSAGETLTASVLVQNSGDLSGTCEVNLMLDGDVVQTERVALDGGDSEEVSFTITADAVGEHQVGIGNQQVAFTVKESQAPAAFTVGEISVDPPSVDYGANVNISVTVANTGDLTGTYQAALSVDDIPVEAREVTIEGGGSEIVVFSFVPSTIGQYTASVNGLLAPFEVRPPGVPPASAPELIDFSLSPSYQPDTDKLLYTRIVYQLNDTWDSFANTSLMLTVFYDGHVLEKVPLLKLSQLQSDGKTGELEYVPNTGWDTGEYAFLAELYQDGNLVQETPARNLTLTPEAASAVVSWKTLGILIGTLLALGLVIFALVLYFRRESLRDYWKKGA